MEITKVKAILGLSNTTKHDEYLTVVLPMFEEKIKQRANNRFLDEQGNEKLPIDLQHTLAKWIQWDMNNKAGLESRRLGDVSYNYDPQIPDFVKKDIVPYRKVKFNG